MNLYEMGDLAKWEVEQVQSGTECAEQRGIGLVSPEDPFHARELRTQHLAPKS
jgi:hypothetical protein